LKKLIRGWSHPIVGADGNTYVVDFALPEFKVVFECDGDRYHNPTCIRPREYSKHLWRQNALIEAGWQIYRFSYDMVMNTPDQTSDSLRRVFRRLAEKKGRRRESGEDG